MNDIFEEIKKERQRQDEKWGEQNHDPVMWMNILMEEVGEAARESLESYFENDEIERKLKLLNYRKEIIQIAAVAVEMIESLERNELKDKLTIKKI